MGEIKVLVVDDSAFMRKLISDMLDNESDIHVVGTARNGQDALKKIELFKPDLLTLDVQMPVMDGLECLEKIMALPKPLPVIMLSSLTAQGAEDTMKALALGAVDFVQKPSGSISLDIDKVKDELLAKVRMGCRSNLRVRRSSVVRERPRETARRPVSPSPAVSPGRSKSIAGISKKLLLIGTSTGGPRALQEVLPKLPADIPANILVVQHMPAGFTLSLANRLNDLSRIKVAEAKEGDILEQGTAYLAPGGYHMVLGRGGVLKLHQGPTVQGVRPAYDVLLHSVAENFSGEIVNVVMTGMGKDGTDGTLALQKLRVKTIAEDKSSCVVYGMPKSIVDKGLADKVVPVERIADEIMKFLW